MVEKKDIEKLVVQKKKSNLKNHWKDSQSYNSTKYSGEIRQNEILLWRSAHFIRGVYPIFHLTFDQNNKLKEIKMEKNPFHIFLNRIMAIFFILLTLTIFFSGDLKPAILTVLAFTIIGYLMHLLLTNSKTFETKILIEELKVTIESIEHSNNPEITTRRKLQDENVNEWSFSKIMTRILIYPFCIFIIWFSIIGLIPDGKIMQGIIGIITALAYPISDLLLMIKKIKNHNQHSNNPN